MEKKRNGKKGKTERGKTCSSIDNEKRDVRKPCCSFEERGVPRVVWRSKLREPEKVRRKPKNFAAARPAAICGSRHEGTVL